MKKIKNLIMVLIAIFTFCLTKNVFADDDIQVTCVSPTGSYNYNISFNSNGGSAVSNMTFAATLNPEFYDELTLPTTTKTGYTFNGWYKDSSFSTVIPNLSATNLYKLNKTYVKDSNDCDTGEIRSTLYAKWTASTYTVSFNTNGGTGGQSANVTATYGSAMPTISTTAPTKTGYKFLGWYDAKTNGTKYYNANGTSAKNWNKTSNTTLYAIWEQETNTGTASPVGSDTDTSDSGAYLVLITGEDEKTEIKICSPDNCSKDTFDTNLKKIELPSPKKDGYEFGGWYLDDEFKVPVKNTEEVLKAINKTQEQLNDVGSTIGDDDLSGISMSGSGSSNGETTVQKINFKLYAKWNKIVKTGNTGINQSSLLIIIGSIMIISGSVVILKKRKD